MPAPEERITLNQWVSMVLQGSDNTANKEYRPLLITKSRELVTYSPMRANNGDVIGIIRSDAQNILRVRPYETIFPVESVALPTSPETTVYTSTSSRSRIYITVVNSGNVSGATCKLKRYVNSGSAGFDILPSGTPCPLGVPIVIGHIDLDATGYIAGTSSSGTIVVNVRVDRYNATGDTP